MESAKLRLLCSFSTVNLSSDFHRSVLLHVSSAELQVLGYTLEGALTDKSTRRRVKKAHHQGRSLLLCSLSLLCPWAEMGSSMCVCTCIYICIYLCKVSLSLSLSLLWVSRQDFYVQPWLS